MHNNIAGGYWYMIKKNLYSMMAISTSTAVYSCDDQCNIEFGSQTLGSWTYEWEAA